MEPVIDVSSKLIRQLPPLPRAFLPLSLSLLFVCSERGAWVLLWHGQIVGCCCKTNLPAGGRGAGDGRPALFKMCSGVPEVENRTLAERKIAISYGLKRCIAPHSLTPWLPITWQCPCTTAGGRSWFAGQM